MFEESPRQRSPEVAVPFAYSTIVFRDQILFLNKFPILSEQGESVNILLNFTQFFETRIEYRFQI
ncbi:hypothetical protein, partial [Aeromonas allosaccharophila]|uniref:hypothetical protein n=1 Tax=Aeromonas allosaccharophila TaxID=656 RepID=UPI003D1B313C